VIYCCQGVNILGSLLNSESLKFLCGQKKQQPDYFKSKNAKDREAPDIWPTEYPAG
jgi:hypothetical protein